MSSKNVEIYEKTTKEEKAMKWKTENKMLKKEVMELKIEVKMLKVALFGLIVAWFFFAYGCMVKNKF